MRHFVHLKLQSFILFSATLLSLLIFTEAHASATCQSLFETSEKIKIVSTSNQKELAEIKKQSPELFVKIKASLIDFMQRFKPQQINAVMSEKLYLSVKNLMADTTGKRVENKVTADTLIVEKAMGRFKMKLAAKGLQLVDRDKKFAGLRNVTYTEYTQPFSVNMAQLIKNGFQVRDHLKNQPNETLNVKIRIRSYGTVPEEKTEFGIKDITFAKFTEDRAFVELKFKDPSYEGAVFKPQMYMNKKYIKMFGTKEFIEKYDEIKSETLAHLKISEKKSLDQTSVEAMLDFVYQAHLAEHNLSIVAINLYERAAKSVLLKYNSDLDPNFDKQFGDITNAELQMTFDQLISLYIPGEENSAGVNQYYHSYGPEQTVSEFKTPTYIAHHLKKAQDAAKAVGKTGLLITSEHATELEKLVPGLKEYFEFMDEIIQSRDLTKELNRGKWGIAIKKVKDEVSSYFKTFFTNELVEAN